MRKYLLIIIIILLPLMSSMQIEFINPTPANESVIAQQNITIQTITDSETPITYCKLIIKKNNESKQYDMKRDSYVCNYTLSHLENNTNYTYYAFSANDTIRVFTEKRDFYVNYDSYKCDYSSATGIRDCIFYYTPKIWPFNSIEVFAIYLLVIAGIIAIIKEFN